MEIEAIKELITAFKEANLTSLSLKCDDFEVKLGKEMTVSQVPIHVNPVSTAYEPTVMAPRAINETHIDKAETMQKSQTDGESLEANKYIKSPIVGTFYSASSPDAQPFITIGSKVKKGDVVCILEAMKLMNEVESEEEGEIVEILVQNEEMVEYGQPLFRLK